MERRAKFRVGLSTLYLPSYDQLCEALASHNPGSNHPDLSGYSWQPYQGLRTFQEQDRDYLQGRQGRPGGIITNAKGGESPHQYGCATDWTLFDASGNALWLHSDHPVWKEFQSIVESVGLKSGAGFHDPDHAEVWIDCDWKHVLLIYTRSGMTAAQQHIQMNLHHSLLPAALNSVTIGVPVIH